MRVLGLFAKEPIPGTCKTRLAKDIGDAAAIDFVEAGLQDLLERCGSIGDLRILGYAPDSEAAKGYFEHRGSDLFRLWPQPPGNLDQRIEAFLSFALCSGMEVRTVLIGSDSPSLPATLINDAFEALRERDVVLGPAADGGYYLIGVRRQVAGWLREVRWSSASTLRDTVAAATNAGLSLAVLSPWYDIDTADDLQMLAGHLAAWRAADPTREFSRTERWLQRWIDSVEAAAAGGDQPSSGAAVESR